MTTVKLVTNASNDPLVLGLGQRDGKLIIASANSELFSAAERRWLITTLVDLGATGKVDEVTKVPFHAPRMLVFIGLGKEFISPSHETLRRAAGSASRHLDGQKSATFSLPHRSIEELAAIAEGAAIGAYGFHDFRVDSKSEHQLPLVNIAVLSPLTSTAAKKAIKRAMLIAKQTHLVRDLVNTPPSHLTPINFSTRMKKEASALSVKVEIMNAAALKAKGYGGITSVGAGSANPPSLLRISYSPVGAKKRIAFVGKGITFDTGGLNLKPGLGMEAMKSDMGGAAAVIAAVLVIAELKLPIAIDGWAAMAENMVSSTATRPSDIITIYGGKTVEVLNPDAEGRLVLSDAMVRAQEFGRAAGNLVGLVDVATLTGAQGIALGKRVSAIMTNNEEFLATFRQAAEEAGENFWPMPLPEELRASLDSPVADMANIGERMGGMLVAGLFLREFISDQLPWLHLDIAKPAYNSDEPFGYTPFGGTGVALRSLVRLAELISAEN